MEIAKKTLVLGFTNGSGKAISLTINKPAEGLSAETVGEVMDTIIASKAFGEGSVAVAKTEAKYVIQQVDKIELA